jgi:transcriptional regulator
MFLPRHFAETDPAEIAGLLRRAGFGHLVVAAPEGLAATPLPFVVDDELTSVRAHLARPNDVWRLAPCDALVVVPVSDAYVSPGWYPSKSVDGRVVPTWNYEVVHLHGRLVVHDDADWVRRQISELTDLNESAMPAPWEVADAPDDFIDQLQRGIVGVELEVTRVEAKRKLSQNKSADDVAGAVAGLRAASNPRAAVVAAAMDG